MSLSFMSREQNSYDCLGAKEILFHVFCHARETKREIALHFSWKTQQAHVPEPRLCLCNVITASSLF
jgi:hypothetical protein